MRESFAELFQSRRDARAYFFQEPLGCEMEELVPEVWSGWSRQHSQNAPLPNIGKAIKKNGLLRAHMPKMRHEMADSKLSLPKNYFCEEETAAEISIWKEALCGAEMLLLHASPVYYGLGIPHGDGTGVVVIPGFLGTDLYLSQLHSWLGRIGYKPYLSGIGLNAECPNLLIQHRLNETIDKAVAETGRKIHLIGHSLGGIMARAVACQRSEDVGSVISLGSPFRGTVAHQVILRAAEQVRKNILKQHSRDVLPTCYTAKCTCDFLTSLRGDMPSCVFETAIYTCDDGIVDWRYCVTGDCGNDFEVPGTHIGLAFNASAYSIIATRLANARSRV